jgi:two-component system, oxyanion-binding sensor
MNNTPIKLGFIPLTDCLPIIAAEELGYFAQEGITVTLQAEKSWANIRDKLTIGQLDAAHMLAPLMLANTLGLSGIQQALITAFSFGLNGNAITVSATLHKNLQKTYAGQSSGNTAAALAEIINKRAAQGLAPLMFATVFPFSCHFYQLRDWLEGAGVNTQTQVKFCVLPPEQMVTNLKNRNIDGFCVGEPWNSHAIFSQPGEDKPGCIAATGFEIWGDAPEKVLAVRADWANAHSAEHAGMVRALYKAAEWVEYHRQEAADLLIRSGLLQVSAEAITNSLLNSVNGGDTDCHKDNLRNKTNHHPVFHRNNANEPDPQQAIFLLKKMQRYGQLSFPVNLEEVANNTYKPKLFHAFIQLPQAI